MCEITLPSCIPQTCLFGVGAMLWSAADYCLPSNQEPALSEEFENLLMSMTQDEVDNRPPVLNVLKVNQILRYKNYSF
jgi:hypothetical protein